MDICHSNRATEMLEKLRSYFSLDVVLRSFPHNACVGIVRHIPSNDTEQPMVDINSNTCLSALFAHK